MTLVHQSGRSELALNEPSPAIPADTSSLRLRIAIVDGKTMVNVHESNAPDAPTIATIDASETNLADALPETHASAITALDVLEHVLDEEAWIAAAARWLEPGGTLTVRVPIEGPLAWLDALNLYRYVQDTMGGGKDLKETRLKGWHRHYLPSDVLEMLRVAGFETVLVKRSGTRALDAVQFGGLLWGGVVRHDTSVEARLRDWRDAIEARDDLPRQGALSSKLTVTARRLAVSSEPE